MSSIGGENPFYEPLYDPKEPQEIRLYQELYGKCVDISNPNILNPIKLIDLIGRSCLDKSVLRSIWEIGTQGKKILDKNDLYACVRCVALAQAGESLSLETLKATATRPGLYPKFATWAIPPGVKQGNYEPLFRQQKLPNGKLSEGDAKEFFKMSSLHEKEIHHVFVLCDVDRDRSLSLEEFCVAMHMVLLIKQKKMAVPKELPPELALELSQSVANASFSQPSTPRSTVSVSSSASKNVAQPAPVVPPAVGAPATHQEPQVQTSAAIASTTVASAAVASATVNDNTAENLKRENESLSGIMHATTSLNGSIRDVNDGVEVSVDRLMSEKTRLSQELDFLNAEKESQMRSLTEATARFQAEQAAVAALNEEVKELRLTVESLREQTLAARMEGVTLMETKSSLGIEKASLVAEAANLKREGDTGSSTAAESTPEPLVDAPQKTLPKQRQSTGGTSTRPQAPGQPSPAVAAAPEADSPAVQQQQGLPPPTRQAPEATPPVAQGHPPSPSRPAPTALPPAAAAAAAETSDVISTEDPFNSAHTRQDSGPILQNDPFSTDADLGGYTTPSLPVTSMEFGGDKEQERENEKQEN